MPPRPPRSLPAVLGEPRVVSVNVGTPKPAAWAGLGETAMEKTAVEGPVRVTRLGLAGDQVGDIRHHGGIDQAVYVFAREDLDWWSGQLGRDLPDGHFSENLTTAGIDVNEAEVGERWRVGTAVLEVGHVRTPCNDFKMWLGETGYDNTHWVKRFTQIGRPGPYLRVLEEGTVSAGDPIEVLHRPGHGFTASDLFHALNVDRTQLPRVLDVAGVSAEARAKAQLYVDGLTIVPPVHPAGGTDGVQGQDAC